MKNNSFKLMATLLLCASIHQLVSEQSINQKNQITVNDLKNDLAYIDDFLTTVYGMKSILLPEEIELINHDLLHIEKYLSGYHDRSDVLQILNIVNQKFAKAQKYEQDLKDLERPKEPTEIKLLQKKMPTQAAPVLTKTEGKQEQKGDEFSMFLSSSASSSSKSIVQPIVIDIKPYQDPRIGQLNKDIQARQDQFREFCQSIPNIVIKNNTEKTLIIESISIAKDAKPKRQEIAPGQKSSPINKATIKSLGCKNQPNQKSQSIDISNIIKPETITVKAKQSPLTFFSGDSYNIEPEREFVRD